MQTHIIIACPPVGEDCLQLRYEPAPGAIVGACDECNREIWIGVKSQAQIAKEAHLVLCMECAVKSMQKYDDHSIGNLGGTGSKCYLKDGTVIG